jgi:hypothetical protein
MALETAQVSVTTTATKLTSAVAQVSGDTQEIAVKPNGTIYVGGSGVTTANGFEVQGGEVFSISLRFGEDLYGITATGTVATYVIRQGV